MAERCCAERWALLFRIIADLLRPCLHAQVCKGWMGELVLHVPVTVESDQAATRQWLLQPVPHGLRIASLALGWRRDVAGPAAAMPQDLLLMQTSRLQNIQDLELQDAQCPDFPPVPRLTELTMSFRPSKAHPMFPLPKLTVLEALAIEGVSSCPSLTCLSRLTRLSLTAQSQPCPQPLLTYCKASRCALLAPPRLCAWMPLSDHTLVCVARACLNLGICTWTGPPLSPCCLGTHSGG